ncbi:uncharacterized protein LOC124190326 [Daphnia pulex]|uniref:uncharacterized protein LOC124190326 n=1 Tax=Daphnia pulex TaxID=6669 RepID=UPI001EDE1913|nr:uncharacterized protein LOC124190326 [Daphnia pulex]
MLKAGHYTDLLRQVNELKRQLHLVEAERKACEDEGNETIKRNQQQLNRLKQDVGDIKSELSDTVRNTRQNHPSQSSQMGILQVLKANNIDYSKYKLTKSADEILTDLDWRTADLVKQADLTKHQTQMIYQRINEIDEQLAMESDPSRAESPVPGLSSAASSLFLSAAGKSATPAAAGASTSSFAMTKMMDEEATLTEIQSIRQKMVEAYHIQRQYKTILDVISGERIGYESQLTDLEKSTADSKLEAYIFLVI